MNDQKPSCPKCNDLGILRVPYIVNSAGSHACWWCDCQLGRELQQKPNPDGTDTICTNEQKWRWDEH